MSEQKWFSRDEVECIANALESAPPPPRAMSKTEALDLLAAQLIAARGRGHTLESLVEQLAQQGLKTHSRAISEAIKRLEQVTSTQGRKKNCKTDVSAKRTSAQSMQR